MDCEEIADTPTSDWSCAICDTLISYTGSDPSAEYLRHLEKKHHDPKVLMTYIVDHSLKENQMKHAGDESDFLRPLIDVGCEADLIPGVPRLQKIPKKDKMSFLPMREERLRTQSASFNNAEQKKCNESIPNKLGKDSAAMLLNNVKNTERRGPSLENVIPVNKVQKSKDVKARPGRKKTEGSAIKGSTAWANWPEFRCSLCKIGFSSRTKASQHLKTKHKSEYDDRILRRIKKIPYECLICGKNVIYKASHISVHMRQKHKLSLSEYRHRTLANQQSKPGSNIDAALDDNFCIRFQEKEFTKEEELALWERSSVEKIKLINDLTANEMRNLSNANSEDDVGHDRKLSNRTKKELEFQEHLTEWMMDIKGIRDEDDDFITFLKFEEGDENDPIII